MGSVQNNLYSLKHHQINVIPCNNYLNEKGEGLRNYWNERTREQISHNMSRIRSKDTKLEGIFRSELDRRGIQSYTQNDDRVYGRPDFVFYARKIAVFCDSEFWHGYDWENAKHEIKTNKDFWLPKIESNIKRDKEVTEKLQSKGWKVLRFWGKEIIKNASECVNKIEKILRVNPAPRIK